MPLQASQIVRRASNPAAPRGYYLAQGSLALSLGGWISLTALSAESLHNLFDEVSETRNAASEVDYRCFFLHNTSSAWTARDLRVWMHSQVASGAVLAMGLDPTAASRYNTSLAPQAVSTVIRTAAPAGVTFSAPTTEETALEIGDLGPGMVKAIWLRRTAADTDAVAPDGATLRAAFERVAA